MLKPLYIYFELDLKCPDISKVMSLSKARNLHTPFFKPTAKKFSPTISFRPIHFCFLESWSVHSRFRFARFSFWTQLRLAAAFATSSQVYDGLCTLSQSNLAMQRLFWNDNLPVCDEHWWWISRNCPILKKTHINGICHIYTHLVFSVKFAIYIYVYICIYLHIEYSQSHICIYIYIHIMCV